MMRQYELVDRVLSYDPQADEALLNRAYVFSLHAHGGQKRASGDPYFSHPIEVAGLMTELKLSGSRSFACISILMLDSLNSPQASAILLVSASIVSFFFMASS